MGQWDQQEGGGGAQGLPGDGIIAVMSPWGATLGKGMASQQWCRYGGGEVITEAVMSSWELHGAGHQVPLTSVL